MIIKCLRQGAIGRRRVGVLRRQTMPGLVPSVSSPSPRDFPPLSRSRSRPTPAPALLLSLRIFLPRDICVCSPDLPKVHSWKWSLGRYDPACRKWKRSWKDSTLVAVPNPAAAPHQRLTPTRPPTRSRGLEQRTTHRRSETPWA